MGKASDAFWRSDAVRAGLLWFLVAIAGGAGKVLWDDHEARAHDRAEHRVHIAVIEARLESIARDVAELKEATRPPRVASH